MTIPRMVSSKTESLEKLPDEQNPSPRYTGQSFMQNNNDNSEDGFEQNSKPRLTRRNKTHRIGTLKQPSVQNDSDSSEDDFARN